MSAGLAVREWLYVAVLTQFLFGAVAAGSKFLARILPLAFAGSEGI
jgi:hypothetical protein